MNANMQQLKGSWKELLGVVKERWGNLTDDDLNVVEGNLDQLVGKIQKRTGETRNAISDALSDLIDQGEDLTHRTSRAASNMAGYVGDRLQEGSRYIASQGEEGYEQAKRILRHRPVQSIAVMFGVGVGLGLLVGMSLRSR